MHRQSVGGYPGICRVHRAELKMLRGRWSEAEQEARQACEELERFGLLDAVGYAHYQVGEVRLRMGDLDAAAEAFERAYEYGHDAQPGMALLQLARGEIDEAARSIGRALAATAGSRGTSRPGDPGPPAPGSGRHRARGRRPRDGRRRGRRAGIDRRRLPAARVRGRRPHGPWRAAPRRGSAVGGVAASWDGRGGSGRRRTCPTRALERACGTPRPMAAEGDPEAARRDLRAARSAFERLGARRDLQRVDALLGEDAPASIARRRAGDQDVHVHRHRHLDRPGRADRRRRLGRAAATGTTGSCDPPSRSHRGEEVNQTGDGFFVAFERADRRARVRGRHPAAAGAAPPRARVRADGPDRSPHRGGDPRGPRLPGSRRARRRPDRRGRGGRGDPRLRARRWRRSGSARFGLSDPRQLTLKGVEEPVEVRSVDWR